MDTPNAPAALPLEIFRAGTFTDQSGQVATFSEADLAELAASYNPALHRAPLKRGHGAPDDAALGFAGALQVVGKTLLALPAQVSAALKAEVADGQRPGVSIEIYPRSHAANPTPGKLHLKAIALMGAQPPSVKGLAVPAFGEAEPGILRFGSWGESIVSRLVRNLRDFFIADKGLEVADRVLPAWEVDRLQEAAAQPDPEVSPVPSFAEPIVTPEQKAALEAENAGLKARLDRIAADQLATAKATSHAGHLAYAEGQVAAGRLQGKDRDALVFVLDNLPEQASGQPLAFGEGDAARPLVDVVKALVEARPGVLAFGELATQGKAGQPPEDKHPLVAAAEAQAANAKPR